MHAGRLGRDEQRRRDLPVTSSRDQQAQHFEFPAGQPGQDVGRIAPRAAAVATTEAAARLPPEPGPAAKVAERGVERRRTQLVRGGQRE